MLTCKPALQVLVAEALHTCTCIHMERIERFPLLRKTEFEKTGQKVQDRARQVSWEDTCWYVISSLGSLILSFMLAPSLTKTYSKSCAITKCASLASHNVPDNPRQSPKHALERCSCCPFLMGQCLGSGAEVLLGLVEMGLWWADGSWDEHGSSWAGDCLGFPIAIVPLCVCVYELFPKA